MTKEEQLIDRLADKTLSFGCRIEFVGIDCQYECDFSTGVVFHKYKKEGQSWDYVLLDSMEHVCEEDIICCGKILGHPIYLHNVLEKMIKGCKSSGQCTKCRIEREELTHIWQPCGFTRSLQTIFSEDVERNSDCKGCSTTGCSCIYTEQLKPEAQALFQFLINLNL